mgnify:CR=1 FL=1
MGVRRSAARPYDSLAPARSPLSSSARPALLDASGDVVQFLSYEGAFTAADVDPASGFVENQKTRF